MEHRLSKTKVMIEGILVAALFGCGVGVDQRAVIAEVVEVADISGPVLNVSVEDIAGSESASINASKAALSSEAISKAAEGYASVDCYDSASRVQLSAETCFVFPGSECAVTLISSLISSDTKILCVAT